MASDNNNDHGREDFLMLKQFLLENCGIVLPMDKQSYVLNQLHNLLSVNSVHDVHELIERIQQPDSVALRAAVIDMIVINETSWCRDTHPFNALKNIILPEIHRKRPMNSVRIWSAACSTGQESYSISMIIEEIIKMHPTHFVKGVSIIATDISQQVIAQADRGEYDAVVMDRGLSDEWKKTFFDKLPNHHWCVNPAVKKRVQFKQFNLLHDYASLGQFDVIFCRNVLVYFPLDIKVNMLKRMHAALKPGGYLIVGATEVLSHVSDYYQMMQCNPGIVYRAIEK